MQPRPPLVLLVLLPWMRAGDCCLLECMWLTSAGQKLAPLDSPMVVGAFALAIGALLLRGRYAGFASTLFSCYLVQEVDSLGGW